MRWRDTARIQVKLAKLPLVYYPSILSLCSIPFLHDFPVFIQPSIQCSGLTAPLGLHSITKAPCHNNFHELNAYVLVLPICLLQSHVQGPGGEPKMSGGQDVSSPTVGGDMYIIIGISVC